MGIYRRLDGSWSRVTVLIFDFRFLRLFRDYRFGFRGFHTLLSTYETDDMTWVPIHRSSGQNCLPIKSLNNGYNKYNII